MNRKTAPNTRISSFIPPEKPERVLLDNDIPLYLLNDESEETLRVEWVFRAGQYFEEEPLIASAVNAMLNEGSQDYPPERLANLLDFHGAYGIPSSDKDNASFSFYSMSRHFNCLLPAIADILISPAFPEKELESYLHKRYRMYQVNRQKTSSLARETFEEALFGADHPYGKRIRPADFEKVNTGKLKQFHRSRYFQKGCFLILTGNIPSEAVSLLNRYFGQEKLAEQTAQHILPINETQAREIHSPKDDAVQNSLRLGLLLPPMEDPDYPKLEVLNTLLGGFFGSRLMRNLRQEKGLTYGIQSLLVPLRDCSYATIVSDVNATHTKMAVQEVLKEIDKLATETVSAEEWDLVKNYLMADLMRIFNGSFARADALKNVLEHRLDYDYYKRLSDCILEMKPAEIPELARRYFPQEKWMIVTAGQTDTKE